MGNVASSDADLRSTFGHFDKNGNQAMDQAEISAALESIYKIHPAVLMTRALVDYGDANHDGVIKFVEFKRLATKFNCIMPDLEDKDRADVRVFFGHGQIGLGLKKTESGALRVTKSDGTAKEAGITSGAVLVEISGQPVAHQCTLKDFGRRVTELRAQKMPVVMGFKFGVPASPGSTRSGEPRSPRWAAGSDAGSEDSTLSFSRISVDSARKTSAPSRLGSDDSTPKGGRFRVGSDDVPLNRSPASSIDSTSTFGTTETASLQGHSEASETASEPKPFVGTLLKKSKYSKRWKKRSCEVSHGVFYYEDEGGSSKNRKVLILRNASVTLASEAVPDFQFTLSTPSGRELSLAAGNNTELQQWLRAVRAAALPEAPVPSPARAIEKKERTPSKHAKSERRLPPDDARLLSSASALSSSPVSRELAPPTPPTTSSRSRRSSKSLPPDFSLTPTEPPAFDSARRENGEEGGRRTKKSHQPTASLSPEASLGPRRGGSSTPRRVENFRETSSRQSPRRGSRGVSCVGDMPRDPAMDDDDVDEFPVNGKGVDDANQDACTVCTFFTDFQALLGQTDEARRDLRRS